MSDQHILSVKTSAGFGPGKEYHNANCSCGWATGGMNKGSLEKAHAEHIEEARDAAAAKAARERVRNAAPELLEALRTARIALIAVADSALEAGFDQLADIIDEQLGKANAAITKAEGGAA